MTTTADPTDTAVPDAEQPVIEAPGVQLGVILAQDVAERITGQKINPAIFDIIPTGNLIFVVVEENPDKRGLIILPETARGEPAGVGHIIAAGPYAGHTMYATGGVAAVGVIAANPEALLGLHVLFGMHVGTPIRLSLIEPKYNGQVYMMVARDIQAIDTNPIALGDRIQDKIITDSESLIVEG